MDWISVNDNMPPRKGLKDDEYEYVLVAVDYSDVLPFDNKEVSICGYAKDGWSEWDNYGNISTERITHWMPLPEPPKEV